jgi:TRAP-type mannitol/chloroaromatic compound transport system permease small subunit
MGLLRVADAADRIIRWLGQATDWLSPRMLLETFQMLVPRYAFDQCSIVL